MNNTADVVVIGGGIIGMATAFYLARANFGKISVLEKEALLGAGATSKAAGGIRAQFVTEDNVKMSMLSEKMFCQFKEDTNHEALFDQVGYLFLVKEDKDAEVFKKSVAMQKACGLNVSILSPEEIKEVAPHVSLDGVQFGTFCPDDGLGDPHEFLSGYDSACRKMGVNIELEAEVTGIECNGNAVSLVKTVKGNISTPLIVNCAGPYSKIIGRMVGADVRVEPYRRQIVTTGELSFVKPNFPMVVDVSSGLYCHKESKGMLLGWADKNVQPSFDVSLDPDYTDAILERALELMPQLEEAEVANEWAGLYETTPDHRAIIGYESKVKGMFHVCGFSGHGFMHAPAAGIVTTEILSGKTPTIDISSYAPERFADADSLVEETNVI